MKISRECEEIIYKMEGTTTEFEKVWEILLMRLIKADTSKKKL